MRVWKYSTGECLRFFKGHTSEITDVLMRAIPYSAPACEKAESEDFGLGRLYSHDGEDLASQRDELVIVTTSRDTTLRSWLFAEEKALRVREVGDGVKVRAMEVRYITACWVAMCGFCGDIVLVAALLQCGSYHFVIAVRFDIVCIRDLITLLTCYLRFARTMWSPSSSPGLTTVRCAPGTHVGRNLTVGRTAG
jgi:hypothetical protein